MLIFENAYIINLKHRTDRLGNCKKVYSEWFDKITVFEAIENKTGYLGCRDSHINIIRLAKKKKLPYVFILEDDTYLHDFDCNMIIESLNCLQNNFHLLYLGGTLHEKLQIFNNNLYIAKEIFCGHAYFVSSIIYDKILTDYDNGLINVIDVYYKDVIQSLNKSYMTKKLMINQFGGYSDIDKRIVNDAISIYLASQFKKYTDN